MKLSAFLGLAGALGVLFGLEFLLIPEMALAQYGVPTAAPNLMQARYFGSTLLKGAQLNAFQMVAQGVIDVAFESTINSATVLPQKNIFSLPFFINTLENLDKLEAGETGKAIFSAMEEKGVSKVVSARFGDNGITTAPEQAS